MASGRETTHMITCHDVCPEHASPNLSQPEINIHEIYDLFFKVSHSLYQLIGTFVVLFSGLNCRSLGVSDTCWCPRTVTVMGPYSRN